MGWRYLTFCIGAITLTLFFLRFVVFTFHESPKYLLYRGRDDEAIKVLHRIATLNKQHCNLTIETFDELVDDEIPSGNEDSTRPLQIQGAKEAVSSVADSILKELRRAEILFSSFQMARLTILTWIIYAFDYWGFTIAGT